MSLDHGWIFNVIQNMGEMIYTGKGSVKPFFFFISFRSSVLFFLPLLSLFNPLYLLMVPFVLRHCLTLSFDIFLKCER